jgi:hypothetical protein
LFLSADKATRTEHPGWAATRLFLRLKVTGKGKGAVNAEPRLETLAIDWKKVEFDPCHGACEPERQSGQPEGENLNPVRIVLFIIAVAGLAGGLLAPHVDLGAYQSWIWGVAAGAVLSVLLFEIVTSLIKGEVGLDLVAGISISAALAFGETLAAGVVAPADKRDDGAGAKDLRAPYKSQWANANVAEDLLAQLEEKRDVMSNVEYGHVCAALATALFKATSLGGVTLSLAMAQTMSTVPQMVQNAMALGAREKKLPQPGGELTDAQKKKKKKEEERRKRQLEALGGEEGRKVGALAAAEWVLWRRGGCLGVVDPFSPPPP